MLHVKFKAHWGDMGNIDPKILCAPLAPGHFILAASSDIQYHCSEF